MRHQNDNQQREKLWKVGQQLVAIASELVELWMPLAMGVDMVETAIATRSTVGDALQAAAEAHASNGALDEVLVARSAPTLGESWQSS